MRTGFANLGVKLVMAAMATMPMALTMPWELDMLPPVPRRKSWPGDFTHNTSRKRHARLIHALACIESGCDKKNREWNTIYGYRTHKYPIV